MQFSRTWLFLWCRVWCGDSWGVRSACWSWNRESCVCWFCSNVFVDLVKAKVTGCSTHCLTLPFALFSLSQTILLSPDYSCSEEVLSIVSLLSVDTVLYNPPARREEVLAARKKFSSSEGDHMTLLNIYRAFKKVSGNKVSMKKKKEVYSMWRKLLTWVFTESALCLCYRSGVERTLLTAGTWDLWKKSRRSSEKSALRYTSAVRMWCKMCFF